MVGNSLALFFISLSEWFAPEADFCSQFRLLIEHQSLLPLRWVIGLNPF